MTTPGAQLDPSLEDAIWSELSRSPNVNSSSIAVAISQGEVTLSGQVDSYPEKFLAERAALRVRGVTGMANKIEVRSLSNVPTDDDLARQVAEVLDGVLDLPDPVRATVSDHVITLMGSVDWHYQGEAAYRAVAYLKGVTGVVNTIRIRSKAHSGRVSPAIDGARCLPLEASEVKTVKGLEG